MTGVGISVKLLIYLGFLFPLANEGMGESKFEGFGDGDLLNIYYKFFLEDSYMYFGGEGLVLSYYL